MKIEQRTITYDEWKKEPRREYVLGYNQQDAVVLVYREGTVKKYLTIRAVPWYFCIKRKDFEKNRDVFYDMQRDGYLTKVTRDYSDEFVRVYCRNMNKRNVMDPKNTCLRVCKNLNIQTYEADLNSYQRLLIDHHLKIAKHYEVLYFDIETDDRGIGIEIGRDRILSVAAVNQRGRVYYYSEADERKTIKKFFKLAQKYDILVGWNSERFDVPYLRDRARLHHIYFNWREVIQLDLMQKIKELNRRNIELIKKVRGFSLNAISAEFLGEQKVEHTEGIYEMYENNPSKLREYNIQDTVLVKRIDEHAKVIKQKIIEHQITGCFLDEYAISRILDMYLLRHSERGARFKTRPPWRKDNYDDRESKFTGAVVLEPVRGIHHEVYHFDFTSLYPSIIKTFNISPETWRPGGKGIKTPNGQTYSFKQGIIPEIIADLLQARNDIRYGRMKELKKSDPEYEELYFKQYAFKTMANSFYGILGAPFTRYYKTENAESITLSGHYLISLIKRYFEKKGMVVLYGDTDSVFVKGKKIDPVQFRKKVNAFIAKNLKRKFNVKESHIDLKVEAFYDNVFLQDKKRYVKNENGKLKIVGLEARRRETLALAAKKQVELLEMILLHGYIKDEIIKWLLEFKQQVIHGKLKKEDVTVQVKLSKHADEYDKKVKDDFGETVEIKPSKLPHIKVAKWLKKNGIKENGMNTWEKGCYVKFVVTGKVRGEGITAVSVHNYDEGTYDPVYYWNVKFYAMLQRVLATRYPKHDWTQYEIDPKKIANRAKRKERRRRRTLFSDFYRS